MKLLIACQDKRPTNSRAYVVADRAIVVGFDTQPLMFSVTLKVDHSHEHISTCKDRFDRAFAHKYCICTAGQRRGIHI